MAAAAAGVQSGMPTETAVATVTGAAPATPHALPYAHREPYADYFDRLARRHDADGGLRRLITHLDAELDGTERVALWHALWHAARRLPAGRRETIAAALDGRHAAALAGLDRAWDDPGLLEHLIRHTPEAARAGFVPALLARHGLDPIADPASQRPALLLHAVRAALADPLPRLAAAQIGSLQAATLVAAEADPGLLPAALAVLFELALQAADEDTATAVLAELLHHGHGRALRADRVRAWLDGSALLDDEDAPAPLLLATPWQRQWLQPARWGTPAALAALHAALRRPAPRRRLQRLADALQALGPSPAPAPPALPGGEPLQALTALDQAYALIEGGGDAVPAMRPLLETGTLAAAAIAAIWCASARWHAAQGDAEGELLALTQARRFRAGATLRATLAARLAAAGLGPVPALGPDWRDEQAYWGAALQRADAMPRRIAALQLATLWTEGQLEPRAPVRCQRLPEAQALWQRLAADERHAPLAGAALRHPLQTLLRPALQHAHGEDFLWFETPGACAVTVVFSCVATHHSYAEVAALRGRLPGQHLLFIRCADKNWYCDDAFDRVHALLQERVAMRFAAADVTCWYGSMGGHGALKFALAFGWRAIVFNPQTDLDLWAAFRPRERALLWGAERHARLSDWPLAAWESAPVYYACGAHTADREALSVVIGHWRRCRRLDVIVEKFDDPDHAGLMNRIAGGAVAPALARIGTRLRQLQEAPAGDGPALDAAAQADFWDELDAARACKVEVRVRDGRLWWQPSLATGTRAVC